MLIHGTHQIVKTHLCTGRRVMGIKKLSHVYLVIYAYFKFHVGSNNNSLLFA